MSRNPSIRENMKKRLLPHFYRFLLVSGTLWRSLLFILTPKNRPFGIAQTTSRIFPLFFTPFPSSIFRPSIIHTFFRYVTQVWAHRKIFIVMDRRYAFMENFVARRRNVWEIFRSKDLAPIWMRNFLTQQKVYSEILLQMHEMYMNAGVLSRVGIFIALQPQKLCYRRSEWKNISNWIKLRASIN